MKTMEQIRTQEGLVLGNLHSRNLLHITLSIPPGLAGEGDNIIFTLPEGSGDSGELSNLSETTCPKSTWLEPITIASTSSCTCVHVSIAWNQEGRA